MEGTISEIRLWGPTWAPRNWFLCHGQLLSIAQYTAFFSLIGTIYGGDGRTSFAVPDFRGRTAVGAGSGAGLTARQNGQRGGAEYVTLNTLEIPSHNHSAVLSNVTGTTQSSLVKGSGRGTTGNYISPNIEYKPDSSTEEIAGLTVNIANLQGNVTVGLTGGNQGHLNMQPWLCVEYIICYQGIFPSRS